MRQLVIWSTEYDDLKNHLSLNNESDQAELVDHPDLAQTTFNGGSKVKYQNSRSASVVSNNSHADQPSASTEHGNLLSHIIEEMPSNF